MPLFTPEGRKETADRIGRALGSDVRIDGVLLVGSLASSPDRWSDVDLAVVVGGGHDAERVARDWTARLYEELDVLHHFEVDFGTTPVRGFLLEDLLEVDVAFTPASDFVLWGPAQEIAGAPSPASAPVAEDDGQTPDWPGESGYAWHDIVHAYVAARRGRLWQSLWYLERVRNRTLKLAQQRRGYYADFFDYVDDLPTEETSPHEGTLVVRPQRDALLAALELATELFLAELARGDDALAQRLRGPLLELVRLRP